MANKSGHFENVLLRLWRELPHGLTIEREKSRQAVEVLKRWGVPTPASQESAMAEHSLAEFAAPEYACARWAWAVPNEKAIETLVCHSPIVEIGAGTGYWARLAVEAGADAVAYDSRVGWNGRRRTRRGRYWVARCGAYFPVRRGGSNMPQYHAGRTLFPMLAAVQHDDGGERAGVLQRRQADLCWRERRLYRR